MHGRNDLPVDPGVTRLGPRARYRARYCLGVPGLLQNRNIRNDLVLR